MVPSTEKDASLSGSTLGFQPFPTIGGPNPEFYGRAIPEVIDLSDSGRKKDCVGNTFKFERLEAHFSDPSPGPKPANAATVGISYAFRGHKFIAVSGLANSSKLAILLGDNDNIANSHLVAEYVDLADLL